MTERFPREVKFNELDDLFKFSYGVLTNLAFPGVDVPFYFASENDWVAVLRAIFKSRVEFSFSKATASRPISPVPLIDGIAIPLLLADCINSYGEIVVAQSSAIVYPRPQDVEQGELQQAMDVEAPVRFSRLVSTLRMRDMLKRRDSEDVLKTSSNVRRDSEDVPNTSATVPVDAVDVPDTWATVPGDAVDVPNTLATVHGEP
ncbi:unnamed protein product [Heligmosomoides polygyrus]|uniref:Flagellar motor switch protein FliM n=1 Tax=Heligmosomoides polygyrus TaxID=6339 RepID=A0A183GKU1_HELPZ|nr:unnamed protein product [Heligmosomoides polygyrus]